MEHVHNYDEQTGSCYCGDVWDEGKGPQPHSLTAEEMAKQLDGAASALRHGRYATARKKVLLVYRELWQGVNPHSLDQHDASCNGLSPCDMASSGVDQ